MSKDICTHLKGNKKYFSNDVLDYEFMKRIIDVFFYNSSSLSLNFLKYFTILAP